jgi:hypothetical protein
VRNRNAGERAGRSARAALVRAPRRVARQGVVHADEGIELALRPNPGKALLGELDRRYLARGERGGKLGDGRVQQATR